METKKIYRIREKGTEEFMTLGYKRRSSWSVYPSAAIKENSYSFKDKTQYEVVIFEYELKETKTMELK